MIALIVAALFATSAFATGTPEPAKPVPHYVTIDANAASNASAAATASLYANPVATATGGSATTGASTSNAGGASVSQGHSYALAAAPSAAPLPAGTCPQGDSLAWSVGWGFVTYSISSTRTEMACLDKLLALAREAMPKPVEYKMAAADHIHPPAAVPPPPAECVMPPAPKKAAPKKSAKAKPPAPADACKKP